MLRSSVSIGILLVHSTPTGWTAVRESLRALFARRDSRWFDYFFAASAAFSALSALLSESAALSSALSAALLARSVLSSVASCASRRSASGVCEIPSGRRYSAR